MGEAVGRNDLQAAMAIICCAIPILELRKKDAILSVQGWHLDRFRIEANSMCKGIIFKSPL